MDERDPLILTLELEPALFALLNGLRAAHFPRERNLVPAHITLFHALPGVEAGPIAAELARRAAHTAPLALVLPALRFLGRGVALEVVSPGLIAVRHALAQTWAPWLSRQDEQSYRPHVTIQNKVPPEAARRLYDELTPGWQALAGRGEGFCLWHYRGGPWELAARFPFADTTTDTRYHLRQKEALRPDLPPGAEGPRADPQLATASTMASNARAGLALSPLSSAPAQGARLSGVLAA